MSNRPPPGSMVHWRFKTQAPGAWRFGYCTYVSGPDLVRMGCWNGDNVGGPVVSAFEIEWREYRQ